MEQKYILELTNISKQFSIKTKAAADQVSLNLQQGDLLGLLGPSGCGKTTLLRMIAGFEKPTGGEIKIGGEIVASADYWLAPEKRNTGMVFQDYALFPHLTIGENIAFGLKKKKNLNRQQIKERVGEILSLVGLGGLEKRYPHELSGGQQQRIALARALAPQPALILLDEPLSNLDVQVRLRLRHEVRDILKATGISGIFVTHDQEEALAISDRIGVMSEGKLEQIGTPEEIYTNPATLFVAEFVTQANFFLGKREGNIWKTEIGEWPIETAMIANCEQGEIMVRQEDIDLQADEEAKIVIRDRHFLGREYRYCLETDSGKKLHARTNYTTQLPIGTKVKLNIPLQALHIFPESCN